MWFSGGGLACLILSTIDTKNVKPTRYSTTPNTESCANLNDYQETEMQNVPVFRNILSNTTKYKNLNYSKTRKGHYNYEMPKMEKIQIIKRHPDL